jgi:hypothetical protein
MMGYPASIKNKQGSTWNKNSFRKYC